MLVVLQQDRTKAIELWKQAVALGSIDANCFLGSIYREGGNSKKAKLHVEAAAMAGDETARYNLGCKDFKKAKFHYEAAAMAGHKLARFILGCIEGNSGNVERAVKLGQLRHLLGAIRPCLN